MADAPETEREFVPLAKDGPAKLSKSNLTKSQSLSRGNLASTKALGSKNNLRGSFNNLSRFPSQTLKKAVERRDSVPQANAVVYENTYRLKPDTKFGAGAVSKIIDTVLIKNLTKMKYEHEKVPELISTISNEILAEVKKLEYDRYKIVVQVDIGEFKGQGIKVASRCVWDTTTDTWASGSFRNSKLFAVAMVYGCFYE